MEKQIDAQQDEMLLQMLGFQMKNTYINNENHN